MRCSIWTFSAPFVLETHPATKIWGQLTFNRDVSHCRLGCLPAYNRARNELRLLIEDHRMARRRLLMFVLCVLVFGLALRTRLYPFWSQKASIKTFIHSDWRKGQSKEQSTEPHHFGIHNGPFPSAALPSAVPLLPGQESQRISSAGDHHPVSEAFDGFVSFQRPPPNRQSCQCFLSSARNLWRIQCLTTNTLQYRPYSSLAWLAHASPPTRIQSVHQPFSKLPTVLYTHRRACEKLAIDVRPGPSASSASSFAACSAKRLERHNLASASSVECII